MDIKRKANEITLKYLWMLLYPQEQMEACACFWNSQSPLQRPIEPQIVGQLASVLNYREKFVRQRPLEWKTSVLCRRLCVPPLDVFIDDVIREFLIEKHKEMICAILDAEGTPHKGGWIREDSPAPTASTFVRGLVRVRGQYEAKDLLLYYGIQMLGGAGNHWLALKEAFGGPEFAELIEKVMGSSREQAVEQKALAEHEVEKPPLDESSGEFTTLDNVLIKSVVATATGSDGALSSDALEDLIHEVLSLSSDRHRSFFHLGYLDAVLGHELRGEFAGANTTRRGWCLTGYLMGKLRTAETQWIVNFIKDQSRHWDELLDDGPPAARAMLLPHLLLRLGDSGEWRLLRDLLEKAPLPDNPFRAARICTMIYNLAADLVRRGNPAEAIPLLEVLRTRLRGANFLDGEFRAGILAAAYRKLGQAHLRAGRFSQAKELLCQALAHPHFPEAANARTDLGLAEAGFRSLDFILPKDNPAANETAIQALERHVSLFHESLADGPPATNAHFVLGLVAFHRNHSSDAEQHLSAALSGMLKKEEAYQTSFLVDWVRFFLSTAIAEQCQPARLNEVKGLIETCMATAATFPLLLWRRLLRAAALYDDKSAEEMVMRHLLAKRGDAAYALLKESGLLLANAHLRASYRQWLDTKLLSPPQRASDLRLLLDAALKSGSIDEATELLDALEGVAKCDSSYVADFIGFITDRRSDLLAIWPEYDLDNAQAALLERIGRLQECSDVLQRMFYRYRAEGDWEQIQDLLDQFEHLRIPSVDLELLKAQVEHLRPADFTPETPPPSIQNIRVLYVGGNETQEQYQTSIEDTISRKHPGLSVTFYFPGWDSNWNWHLDKLQKLVPQHHVVVINRFIRTQLGRKLRSSCGPATPWRACTGHGRKSITRAIIAAAEWVALRRNGKGNELSL